MLLDGSQAADLALAAQALARGELLGLPTETVYGLAADADQPRAVAQIFSTKGRPPDHPLIVHVADAADVPRYAREVPAFAQALMDAFWPGPLTLILPRRDGVAEAAAGGQATVGLRCPAHPVALALLRAAREAGVHGVAAPSANRFGRVSPTTAAHVQQEFPGLWVLEGGACAVGIESTIVDCTRGQPVVLRPGMVSREQIRQVCAPWLQAGANVNRQPAPRASGTLEAHYAPQARVRLGDAQALLAAIQSWPDMPRMTDPPTGAEAALPSNASYSHAPTGASTSVASIAPQPRRCGVYARSLADPALPHVVFRRMPAQAEAAAAELFALLREMDEQGVACIWVEQVPDAPEWEGVADRLRRAAASG